MKLLSDIPEARRTRALECFRVLRPTVEDGVPLTTVAREAGLPLRTAQKWMATYKREGFAGLARLTRSDRGHCHKLPAQLTDLTLWKPAYKAATNVDRLKQNVILWCEENLKHLENQGVQMPEDRHFRSNPERVATYKAGSPPYQSQGPPNQ